jgi:hypothetical protein
MRIMTGELVERQIGLATLVVRRLLGLPAEARARIPIPGYQDEYYAEATLQVRCIMKSAEKSAEPGTAAETARLQEFASRAESALERSGMRDELATVAAEAVRALLVWPLPGAQPWARSVYRPFEGAIPLRDGS